MNRKALLGMCIALILPVICYWVVKVYSDGASGMPPRYYADTVLTRGGAAVCLTVVGGREVYRRPESVVSRESSGLQA